MRKANQLVIGIDYGTTYSGMSHNAGLSLYSNIFARRSVLRVIRDRRKGRADRSSPQLAFSEYQDRNEREGTIRDNIPG